MRGGQLKGEEIFTARWLWTERGILEGKRKERSMVRAPIETPFLVARSADGWSLRTFVLLDAAGVKMRADGAVNLSRGVKMSFSKREGVSCGSGLVSGFTRRVRGRGGRFASYRDDRNVEECPQKMGLPFGQKCAIANPWVSLKEKEVRERIGWAGHRYLKKNCGLLEMGKIQLGGVKFSIRVQDPSSYEVLNK